MVGKSFLIESNQTSPNSRSLLRGKNLGIDSSVIEVNASLRALAHRNTEEQYWDLREEARGRKRHRSGRHYRGLSVAFKQIVVLSCCYICTKGRLAVC
jgi:hypothetical protein